MPPSTRFRLVALGGLQLKTADGTFTPQIQKRRLALLVLLAVAGARGESRDRVAALLWPESDEERARQSLKQAVYALRQLLGDDAILTDRTTIRLHEAVVASDVDEFARALATEDLSAAVALYHGPFLDGWHLAEGEELERWMEERRSQFAVWVHAALRRLAAIATVGADHALSVARLSRLVQLDPLTTENAMALMDAMAAKGDVVGAIREGNQYQERIHRELGLGANAAIGSRLEHLRAATQQATANSGLNAPIEDESIAPILVSTSDLVPANALTSEAQEPFLNGARKPRRRATLVLAAGSVFWGAFAIVSFFVFRRQPSPPGHVSAIQVLPLRLSNAGATRWADGAAIVANVFNETGDLHANVANVANVGTDGASTSQRVKCSASGGLYVTGQIHERQPATAELDLRDACAGDSVAARSRVESPGTDRRSLVWRAAMELAVARRDPQSQRVALVALSTTASPLAAQAFLRGQASFRRGQYDSAVVAFGRAAQADSEFAIAYHWLSVSADWAGRPLIIESAARRAVLLKHRLPEHDRMIAEGWYALKFGRASAAESIFTSVANSFPDDGVAWLQLGEVLFHSNSVRGKSVQAAVGPFKHVVELDSVDAPALHHLIRLAAMRGDTMELDSLTRRALARGSDPDSIELRAFRAFARSDTVTQRRMLPMLSRAGPGVVAVSTWRTAAFGRNLDAASALARMLLVDPRATAQHQFARDKLAEFAVARGRWSDADAALLQAAADDHDATLELRALLAVVPPVVHSDAEFIALRESLQRLLDSSTDEAQKHVPVRLYLVGLLADRLHDVRTVEAMSRRLKTPTGAARYADPELARSYARGLAGLAARLRGNDRDAITELEAVPFDRFPDYRTGALGSQTYERLVLAGLLQKAGRTAEALGWLHAIGEGLETSWYAAAHREIARIADATGDRKTAGNEYRLFADAWRHCDASGRAMLDEARRRIESPAENGASTRF